MEGLHPDVLIALEYARRWRKGLPSDRFCDGHAGAVATARGIERMASALNRLIEEDSRRADESIETFPDPCRK